MQPAAQVMQRLIKEVEFNTGALADTQQIVRWVDTAVDGTPALGDYNTNYILYWNHVALELNRLTHSESIHGPQSGPPISARALGIVQIAVHDAYFSIRPATGHSTFFKASTSATPQLPEVTAQVTDAKHAVAGAAFAALQKLYTEPKSDVSTATTALLGLVIARFLVNFGQLFGIPNTNLFSPSYLFGFTVGEFAFAELNHAKGAAGSYTPKTGIRYKFDDEPTNPVRIVPLDVNNPNGPTQVTRPRHAPVYGQEAKRFATSIEHVIADPPGYGTARDQTAEYSDAVRDVHRMGGALNLSSTKRTPTQTAKGLFWAYDGANLIGTPPRLYNQVLRKIAVDHKQGDDIASDANNADFARLLALANAAMADAGIFAWKEKYHFEFWRPLSGVRNEALGGNESIADPFWLTLGAPATNSHDLPFKPPFPAYPSGHATFGAAAFQIARLFYNGRSDTWANDAPDNISFDFVSDELNGVSRTLYKPYDPKATLIDQSGDVRTKINRKFSSLWEAIFENAISRIYLGVHWRFDACAAKDIMIPTREENVYATDSNGATVYQNIEDIRYTTTGTRDDRPGQFPIGGVGLGLAIANDIWETGLTPTPTDEQPTSELVMSMPGTMQQKPLMGM